MADSEHEFKAPSLTSVRCKPQATEELLFELAAVRRAAFEQQAVTERNQRTKGITLLNQVVDMLRAPLDSATDAITIEHRLSRLCLECQVTGELRPGTVSIIRTLAAEALCLCASLQERIRGTERAPLSQELAATRAWALSELDRCNDVQVRLESLGTLWAEFEKRRLRALVDFRPLLAQVGRLQLGAEQEVAVARDHTALHRVSAAAGTGKSVVLVHRAIRLLAQSPDSRVLLIAPTDALAGELSEACRARSEGTRADERLRVRSMRDVAHEWFESASEMIDVLDAEKTLSCWLEFIHGADGDSRHVLRDVDVQALLKYLSSKLEARRSSGVAHYVDSRWRLWLEHWRPLSYLRDEISWICSGLSPSEYQLYTRTQLSVSKAKGTQQAEKVWMSRSGREIKLEIKYRHSVMKVLLAWHGWLNERGQADLDLALGWIVDACRGGPSAVQRFKKCFAVEHVLVDEAQKLSNCEWEILLLMASFVGGNPLYVAGDMDQRDRVRRFVSAEVRWPNAKRGLDFRGRASTLRQQYRITQQVAEAGARIVGAFGRETDEEILGINQIGFGACRDGVAPLILDVQDQERAAIEVLAAVGRDRTVGLVSTRKWTADIDLCVRIARGAGRVPRRATVRQQTRTPGAAVIGTIEELAGCEFDVVMVVNFSALPEPSTPREEWWRDASAAYTAMTRARELVVLCCPSPSPFIDKLRAPPSCVVTLRSAMEFREFVARSSAIDDGFLKAEADLVAPIQILESS
ncbi:UvrD-helicase domain-containing protein [Myxococcus llanfairpwllgwyngyllgogerychwyrndrobwllllantysiliogogogochensis]|uniref:UvrD-helicase domain-containing protein n=1 Tax=Myxococcus llanfairpwllgwyngyllgogerychwyrndrobwllllantysiliogogogochensis TaxID=2590453 RepID=UPI0015F054F8|nr:UvrD-helicase domain-containing protein [Myxococcus llanfairpwllgwyngyllgogerychwyrndrobwllllantysiliogogogochensis]